MNKFVKSYAKNMKQPSKGIPEQPVFRTPTDKEKEIQNKVVRSADRGLRETDPTQGLGSKLNKDILYPKVRKNPTEPVENKYANAIKQARRPTRMVNGEVGKIERGNPANRYQEGNNLNVSAFVRDSENQEARKEAMFYAGLMDYYSPGAFADSSEVSRKRKR